MARKVRIRKGMTEALTRQTVIHELVHAFLFSYGHGIINEEEICNFFGTHADNIVDMTENIMGRMGKRDEVRKIELI